MSATPDAQHDSGSGERVIHTALQDGSPVCIRPIGPEDEARMRAGIAAMSDRSRYLRFFTGGRTPPDWVIARLLDADGDCHLAWGAILTAPGDVPGAQDGPAIGAVHAFRDPDHPDCAEFSVAVVDAWHGQGLGKMLTAAILLDAQDEGIDRFHAETLSENRSAIDFTRALGGVPEGGNGTTRGWTLDVAEALARLHAACAPPGIAAVFRALDGEVTKRKGAPESANRC